MAFPIRLLAGLGITRAREFAAGWIEGTNRYKAEGAPAIIPGSMFKTGTVEFAASQAAVAYHIGLERK